jgi:histidinol-phosphate aminotransferase
MRGVLFPNPSKGHRMTASAPHLDGLDNPNPFPGLVALEQRTGKKVALRLGSNESLDAPLELLQHEFGEQFRQLTRLYGDPSALALRQALARIGGFDPDELCLDSGADAVIALCLRALCAPGDTVVCSAGTYPTFPYFARAGGCRVVEVPYQRTEQGVHADLAQLLEQARSSGARVLYLANPDNPTGSWAQLPALEQLAEQLPPGCTLLLDEAYLEFCPDLQAGSARPIPRCIRIRSMSKAYALAGLRVGYALADKDTLAVLNKVKIHFAVGGVAQFAAQLTLDDSAGNRRIIEDNARLREAFSRQMQAYGYRVLPSGTNFVALLLPDAQAAKQLQDTLLDHGIAVHRPPHPAFHDLIRVTVCQAALDEPVLALFAGGAR